MSAPTSEMTALLRTVLEAQLDERATLSRYAFESDGAGGRRKILATVATDLPCGRSPATSQTEREIGERLQMTATTVVKLPRAVDVVVGDILAINGVNYKVGYVPERTSRQMTRRLLCTTVVA